MNNQVRDIEQNAADAFVVTTLEQARLLADGFKLKLLRAFVDEPATVKQVAAALHEKPTRLYRHVDALLAAGLLQVVREQPKRGTVERTFRAVASRFEAAPSLFDEASQPGSQDAIRGQFDAAADALVAALSRPTTQYAELAPICTRVLIEASPERLRELHSRLLDWIEKAASESGDSPDTRQAHAMLVFHRNSDD